MTKPLVIYGREYLIKKRTEQKQIRIFAVKDV